MQITDTHYTDEQLPEGWEKRSRGYARKDGYAHVQKVGERWRAYKEELAWSLIGPDLGDFSDPIAAMLALNEQCGTPR